MDSQIEEIKKRIDIAEFIGAYIPLKKLGRNFKGLCPFHQEKTPSFTVSPERQIWHCFGACGEGGDAIKFLMKLENLTFSEALQVLAEKAGVKLKKADFHDQDWLQKEKDLRINTLAAEYFAYVLTNTHWGEKALTYLEKRGIKNSTSKLFQIGYAPSSWDSLLRFLKKKKFSEEEVHTCGLLVKNDRGHYYDRFRGRIMFPIKDARGNIIGFSGRLLDQDSAQAKYINTPETFLYHKRESLFGIHLAKEAIKQKQNVFLVEGEFDMVTPYQMGVKNIVAIKGSAVTKEQLMVLRRFTSCITLTLDSDNAGDEAMRRAIEEAEGMEFEINVVQFVEGKDPDEAARKNAISFHQALNSKVSFYDYLLSSAKKRYPYQEAFGKKKIAEEMTPYLLRIKNPIVQAHYVKKLSQLIDLSEQSVFQLFRKESLKKKMKFVSPVKKQVTEKRREELIQKYLVSFILQSDNPYQISEHVFREAQIEDFTLRAVQRICEMFVEYRQTHPDRFDGIEFNNLLSAELQPVSDEIYLFATLESELMKEGVEKLSMEVKKYSLKRQIAALLDKSDEEKNKEKLPLLLQNLKEVEKRLSSL